MHRAEHVVRFHGAIEKPTQLGRERREQLFVASITARVTRSWADRISEHGMQAVVQRHLERRHEVEHDAAGVSEMAPTDRGLHTARRAPVTGVLQRKAELGQRRHHLVVVVDRRGGAGEQVHLAQPTQVRVGGHPWGVARVHVRISDPEHLRRFEKNPGHVADRGASVGSLPSEGDGLVGRGAAEEAVAHVRHQWEMVRQLEHEGADQLERTLDRAGLFLLVIDVREVSLEIRLEPDVEAAQREPGVDALLVLTEEQYPHRLNRLVECLGRLGRHLVTDASDLFQLASARRARRTLAREVLSSPACAYRQPLRVVDDPVTDHGQRAIELRVRVLFSRAGLPLDVAQPPAQDAGIVGDRMRHGNGLPHEVEDESLVELHGQRVAVLASRVLPDVFGRPERKHLAAQDPNVLVRNPVGVHGASLDGQQLGPDGGPMGFRIDDDADPSRGRGSGQEVVVVDDRFLSGQHVVERPRLPQRRELTLLGLPQLPHHELCQQPRSFDADFGLNRPVRPEQPLDGRQIGK